MSLKWAQRVISAFDAYLGVAGEGVGTLLSISRSLHYGKVYSLETATEMGTRLRELMKATRDLEEKASANQASALELLRMGEQLQQTVENMKTVRSDDVHFAPISPALARPRARLSVCGCACAQSAHLCACLPVHCVFPCVPLIPLWSCESVR